MEPEIIYEDENFLAVNKPSGMTVNRADTTIEERTLQDWMEEKFKIQNSKFKNGEIKEKTEEGEYNKEYEFYSRGGIVHRLDKETSGIILVAKNWQTFQKLQEQFKNRTIKKVYSALAHGHVIPEEGEIKAPVGRTEWNRKRFGVVTGGREATTKYKTIQNLEFRIKNNTESLTLLELYPETGRTHQIRVHLKYINHPVFADQLYAGRKTAREDRKHLSRLFLHASKLTFLNPTTGEPMTLSAELPKALQGFLNSLK